MYVGLLTTTLMECGARVNSDLHKGRIVHVSNKEHVFNYTTNLPFLRGKLIIPVRTDSDHRLARSIIEAAGKSIPRDVTNTPKEAWANFVHLHRANETGLDPVVTMSFDANWIEFTLRYIVDYRARRGTWDRLFSNMRRISRIQTAK